MENAGSATPLKDTMGETPLANTTWLEVPSSLLKAPTFVLIQAASQKLWRPVQPRVRGWTLLDLDNGS